MLQTELRTQNSALCRLNSTQNSELRTQNPEPRTQNSELKTQNSELKTQNSELRTQNPELRTQNSKLKSKNSKLRTQNSELRTQNSELSLLWTELRTHLATDRTHPINVLRRLSLTAASFSSFQSFTNPRARWQGIRSNAETLRSHIWKCVPTTFFSDCTQSNLSILSFCCRFRTRTAPYDGRRPEDVLQRSITYIREQIIVQANLAETEFEKVYPEKAICNYFLAHLLILHTISGVCSWPVSTKVVPKSGSREH